MPNDPEDFNKINGVNGPENKDDFVDSSFAVQFKPGDKTESVADKLKETKENIEKQALDVNAGTSSESIAELLTASLNVKTLVTISLSLSVSCCSLPSNLHNPMTALRKRLLSLTLTLIGNGIGFARKKQYLLL